MNKAIKTVLCIVCICPSFLFAQINADSLFANFEDLILKHISTTSKQSDTLFVCFKNDFYPTIKYFHDDGGPRVGFDFRKVTFVPNSHFVYIDSSFRYDDFLSMICTYDDKINGVYPYTKMHLCYVNYSYDDWKSFWVHMFLGSKKISFIYVGIDDFVYRRKYCIYRKKLLLLEYYDHQFHYKNEKTVFLNKYFYQEKN